MERGLEDIIQQCVDRLARGATVEELLLAHPDDAHLIEPALRSAEAVIALPRAAASSAARTAAMGRMLNEVATPPPAHVQWFAPLLQRSRAFQAAAVAGSIALFGVAGLGAAAATGAGPEPVREFFGLSSSTAHAELEGVVVSVEPSANTLQVSAGGGIHTVIVNAATTFSRGGDAITLADVAAGDAVEVKGQLQPDHSILAVRIRIEDDTDADNGGPGNADDRPNNANDDTPGPGNVDDRGEDPGDDDHGLGNDEDDEDNSGPGNSEDHRNDDRDDDDRGNGNGNSNDNDDNNGNGGGDDNSGPGDDGDDEGTGDEDDDSSGPGEGADDDQSDDDDGSGQNGNGGGNDGDDEDGDDD
jgi:hypothetical protein